MYKGLAWRGIGPATMSGRIADFAVARTPGAPDALYVGASIGGVWKSIDWGSTWNPVFDASGGMSSIGDVAVAPSNPNIVWVGTGEANSRQSSSWGDGVYKSVDAGKSWSFVGLKESRHIGRIVIHPTNPDIVYVAALGHLWGPNAERGVFRTTDGGATWEKVLFVNDYTGAVDLVMDPQDPQTIFAAMYQRQRTAWGMNGGGTGSGLHRTTNGGRSWTKLAGGLPQGELGRIGLDIYRRDGRIVYAVVEADAAAPAGPDMVTASVPPARKSGIYRSGDRGETWEQVSTVNVRPMYFSLIRIDPNDPQRIYAGGTSIMTSHDGGRTFFDPGYGGQGVHPDQHAMWIDPDNSNNLVLGNDGGVYLSYNKGASWRFIDNLPLGQFYEVDTDMRDPYHVCGGLQDNGDWCTPSAVKDMKGLSRRDAYLVGGGDGYYVRIDQKDPSTVYVEQGGASIKRFNYATGETQEIQPVGDDPKARLRGNWNAPFHISSFDNRTIYVGMNRLFRSRDRGVTWTAISPDLTLAMDRDTLQIFGARVGPRALSRHDGVSVYSTLTTVGESTLDKELLYTGSDDGQIQVTRDGGVTWTNVTARLPGLPKLAYASRVTPSRHVAGRVYATFDLHRSDDYKPYVYVSNDFGQSWRAIVKGLPETSVYTIQEHPRVPNLLFVGHEKGVHVSTDLGENWVSANTNLPIVPVASLLVHPRENDLVVATFGRAFWILDDLGPLEAVAAAGTVTADRVLPGKPGRIFNTHHYNGWFWAGHFEAANPEYGAPIGYWLSAPANSVQVQVQDPSGAVIRTYAGTAHAGINRLYWDLRYEPTEKFDPKAVYNPVFRPVPVGPPVAPGRYIAVIKVGGRADLRATLDVQGDPAVTVSEADRTKRQGAIGQLYGMQKSAMAAQEAVRPILEQLNALHARTGAAAMPATMRARVSALADSLGTVDRAVGGALRSAGRVLEAVAGYTGAPTVAQTRSMGWAFDDLTAAITKLNGMLQKEVPELFSALQAGNVWPSSVRSVPLPARDGR
jgi:photosystem II stability/assembly factor-like uncharacterized protein